MQPTQQRNPQQWSVLASIELGGGGVSIYLPQSVAESSSECSKFEMIEPAWLFVSILEEANQPVKESTRPFSPTHIDDKAPNQPPLNYIR